ncbi:50S ribosomal protein L32 [Janibacter melonis]|uniref:50S ribosomal protein L32 n=1 Tax=Janibacter melonis TaxID=262209 RepID=UPI001E4ACE38|nr:50S ribosomal protein L32 [Janibacter melonis]MCB5992020.1 50S ribosomal protein L32 [Janibacter melonis]
MAVPKGKTSRSRTRHRRATWRARTEQLVPVIVDGTTVQVPRRLVRAVRRGLVDPRRSTP